MYTCIIFQWARNLGLKSSPPVRVPLHSCEHFYIITKPAESNPIDRMMPGDNICDILQYKVQNKYPCVLCKRQLYPLHCYWLARRFYRFQMKCQAQCYIFVFSDPWLWWICLCSRMVWRVIGWRIRTTGKTSISRRNTGQVWVSTFARRLGSFPWVEIFFPFAYCHKINLYVVLSNFNIWLHTQVV